MLRRAPILLTAMVVMAGALPGMSQQTGSLHVRIERREHHAADRVIFRAESAGGKENVWIKTTPGKGWFAYFRIYGPDKPAFDGSWKPGDFEEVK
jgi:hypothetical protein